MKKRIHIYISGRVQGVFFRRFIYQNALRLNIKGYVRNINNEVEAVFEGEEKNINELIELCKTGPVGARVDNLKILSETIKNEKDFKILT